MHFGQLPIKSLPPHPLSVVVVTVLSGRPERAPYRTAGTNMDEAYGAALEEVAPLAGSCETACDGEATACAGAQNVSAGCGCSEEGVVVGEAVETARQPQAAASELERNVRQIQKGTGTAAEKTKRIHELFAAQRNLAASVVRRSHSANRTFPGAGARNGCVHYSRRCWIRAECCKRFYPCRRCHDEAESHEIDRKATRIVACVACGDDDQPVAPSCRTCGVRFAKYFCKPCRLYNDAPQTAAYHCDGCGICRVGKAEDNYHCERCDTCVPRDARDNHPCRERNLDNNCPICGDHLATSTDQTIFLRCSHPIHVACLEQYMARHFVCPLCSKCIHDRATMDKWYRYLDGRVAAEQMPQEYANRVSKVLCNDCETKSLARFHFRFHRCNDCHGYNTRLLEHYEVQPSELPPPVEAPAVQSHAAAGPSEEPPPPLAEADAAEAAPRGAQCAPLAGRPDANADKGDARRVSDAQGRSRH